MCHCDSGYMSLHSRGKVKNVSMQRDGKGGILHQWVQGAVRAVRVIWNTALFLMENKHVSDDL